MAMPKRDREVVALEKVVEALRLLQHPHDWRTYSPFDRQRGDLAAVKRVISTVAARAGMKVE